MPEFVLVCMSYLIRELRARLCYRRSPWTRRRSTCPPARGPQTKTSKRHGQEGIREEVGVRTAGVSVPIVTLLSPAELCTSTRRHCPTKIFKLIVVVDDGPGEAGSRIASAVSHALWDESKTDQVPFGFRALALARFRNETRCRSAR